MKLRRKTRKRLTILLAATLSIGVVGGGVYAWRLNQIHQRVAEDRKLGLEYLDQGDDYNAMHYLGRYLRKETDDINLLYQYGKLRMRVREARGAHLSQAVTVMRRVVEMQPDNLDAAHDLLDLYMRTGLGSEGLDLADRLLQRNPGDVDALAARTSVLYHTRKYDEAYKAAEQCLKLQPLNMDVQLLRLSILQSRGTVAQELRDEIEALAETHEGDPRAELLAALTAQYAQDPAAAKTWAKAAIDRTPPDADFVVRTVRILDQIDMSDDAARYLDQHAPMARDDEQLQRVYVRRLWERGMTRQIVEAVRGLDPANRATDGDLLGLYGISLLRTGQRDEAAALVTALRERMWDDASQAWVAVLDSVLAPEGESTPTTLVEACKQALSYQPDHQVFHHLLAEAYQSMGETELALASWRQAIQSSPTWLEPRLRVAQTLLDSDRAAQAFAVAQETLVVAPMSINAAIILADAWEATADDRQLLTGSSLLKLIDLVQKALPGEPRTLCVRASVLAEQGNPDAAKACLQSMLDANENLDQRLVMRCVEISRRYRLGMADAIFQRERALRGMSASLGYALAMETYAAAGPDAALETFDQAAKPNDTQWRVARARLLTSINSPQALGAWKQLANDMPDNARVQQMVLSTPVAWQDSQLVEQATQRLKELTGDDGVRWRIARARQLLTDDTRNGAAIEAARLLADVARQSAGLVECHVLLAEAYRRLDNPASAAEHLTTAVNLRPEAVEPRLLLAKMLHAQGAEAEALRQTDAVLASTIATDEQRLTAVTLLAAQGQDERALTLLKSLYDNDPLPPNLLAAQIFRRTGRLDDAEAVARKLLPKRQPQVIAFTADLLASRGETQEAEAILAQLDQAEHITAAQRALIRADHLARHGQIDAAVAQTERAVALEPSDAAGWIALSKMLIVTGRADDLSSTIAAAHEQVPDNTIMALLYKHRDLVVEAAAKDGARALLLSLLDEGRHRDAALATLELMHKAAVEMATLASATAQFRTLADRNPQLLPLQNLVAQMYAQLGQNEEVLAVSSRAMQAHPEDAESAAMAARALANMKRWSEALTTAREWRRRAGGKVRQADQIIAVCLLELGNPQAALRELQVDTDAAVNAEDAALPAYVRALVDAGRTDEAKQLLMPMLNGSPRARALMLDIGSIHLTNHAVAATWIEAVDSAVAPQAVSERVRVARAWYTLQARFGVEAYTQRALRIGKELVSGENPTAEALVAYGIMCDEQRDATEAERAYRRALELEPGHPVAQNNLAMLLVEREGFGSEATKLARSNMERFPQSATLQDTFGEIAVKMELYDDAIAAMRRAVELEPATPQWKVKLAWALARAGRTDEAWKTLRTVSSKDVTDLSRKPTMQEHVKELLELTAQ